MRGEGEDEGLAAAGGGTVLRWRVSGAALLGGGVFSCVYNLSVAQTLSGVIEGRWPTWRRVLMLPGVIVTRQAPAASPWTVVVSWVRAVTVAVPHTPRARLVVFLAPLVRRCRGSIRVVTSRACVPPLPLGFDVGFGVVSWATPFPGYRLPPTPLPWKWQVAGRHNNAWFTSIWA